MRFTDRWLASFDEKALPLLKRDYHPERVILFGSRIKGTATEDSDIDVILVARCFEGIPFVKRSGGVLKNINFNKHVDLLCYSPQEFERNRNSSAILSDAMAYGVDALIP